MKKIILRAAGLLLAPPILCLWVGCVSSCLPPGLSESQSSRLSELPLPYSIGVTPYERPIFSERLTAALKAAGVFSKVEPLAHFTQAPDFVAAVEKSKRYQRFLASRTLTSLK